MKVTNLEAVYLHCLKDLASVEKQLASALTKLAEGATNEQLKQIFTEHQLETVQQGEKVNALIEGAGGKAGRRKCKGIAGIIEEGDEMLSSTGDADALDAALIGAAQRAEHYEMAAYGTAAALAAQLGRTDDEQVLREILNQEKQADKKLSSLATGDVNPEAADEESTEESNGSRYQQQGRTTMPYREEYEGRGSRSQSRGGRYDEDYNGGGRGRGGQERDEYGRFTSEDDDRGYSSSRRGSSGGGRYDDEDSGRGSGRSGGGRFGGYEGRSEGGRHSAEMQERDEYGRFAGYEDDDRGYSSSRRGSSSGGGGRYDDDDNGYSRSSRGGRGGDITDSAGRHYTRESWERAQEGRSLGGQHSHGGRGGGYDDDNGYSRSGSRGSSSRGGGRYEDDDDNNGYSRSSRGGRGGDITDSAGRHYTRESWERAQEGRSLGGQHSHGGGRR